MGKGSIGARPEASKGSNKDKSTEHFSIVSVKSFQITEHVKSIKPHEY